ncbi:hypothetical protein [Candidatus Nitrotoga sp. HW29]|uniref:hypothetical protein n=1 Tax=Candidatus Nitrotoga sp. HW29 TaxID=2886963 RepID=UPI001EF1B1E9|nr:hypothetical protein [Candidatus Nitrotoga sp. HW29]
MSAFPVFSLLHRSALPVVGGLADGHVLQGWPGADLCPVSRRAITLSTRVLTVLLFATCGFIHPPI